MHYRGDIAGLEAVVANAGLVGVWRELPRGVYQFRTAERGIVNWYSTTGALLCQGPENQKSALYKSLEAVMPRQLDLL